LENLGKITDRRTMGIKIGPCSDSVAVTKESSFFKLGEERERRKRLLLYHMAIVDLKLSILAVFNCCQHNK
jgi:hypothetical protein